LQAEEVKMLHHRDTESTEKTENGVPGRARLKSLFCLLCLSLCSLCLCGEFAFAHPIPNTNHDRIIKVNLTPDGVAVDYSLEVAPETASRELLPEEIAQLSDYKDFYPTYLKHQKAALVDNLDARLDGKDLRFTCVASRFDIPSNIYTLRFTAPWELEPGKTHRFTFRDANYELDDFSGLRVTLTSDDALTLNNVVAPDETLMSRPGADRKPGDGEKLRKASADVRIAGKDAEAPPTSSPMEQQPTSAGPVPPAPAPGAPAPAPERPSTLMQLLLDTRQGWAVLLVLAAAFGAAHALTPGHGKTLVAAYLVGERGTVGHAFLLGVTTTLTHTAAVLVIAGLLPLFFPSAPPADVQRVLELTGGLLVAGLGVFLLNRRLTGGHDHIHIGGGHHHHHHHHHHDHDHDHPHDHDHHHHHDGHEHLQVHEPPSQGVATAIAAPAAHGATTALAPAKGEKPVWWRLIVLGVSGGIVPCWDAIAMLGLAISAGRLWLGLPLLLSFSAGLAGVLVALGVSVVYARNFAGKRFGGMERLRPVFRALPLVSAVFITLMGVWLCFSSLHT
jgi:nickel/cobalt exporter